MNDVCRTPSVAIAVLAASCGRGPSECARSAPDDGSDPGAAIVFTDERPGSGIHFPLALPSDRDAGIKDTVGHAAGLIDADGDGWLDLLLAGPDRVQLFRNLGAWKFAPVDEAGFRQPGFWQGVAVGDVDRDGRPDVFLSGLGCAALYTNAGGNRFRDVTDAAGLGDVPPNRWQTSAAFADVDRDGWLDLYVTCYVDLAGRAGTCTYPSGVVTACSPLRFAPQRGRLYRNRGHARFVDATTEYGLEEAHGNGLGVAFGDANADGYPDLYLANDQRPCDLYVNEAGRRFENHGARSGTALRVGGATQAGMGADFGDYDNDGRVDLVVTNYLGEPTSLYRNDGDLLFSNATAAAGLGPATTRTVGWGTKWADFDNDGLLDLAIANGHPLHRIHELDPSTTARQRSQVFRNAGDGRLVEVRSRGDGLPAMIAGRALCTGDLDNDGRVDLLISNIEGEPVLLRNRSRSRNHWLTIRLAGPGVTDGTLVVARAGALEWRRYSSTGGSYLAASDPRVHLGLGVVGVLDAVEVRWPDGHVTRLENIAVDREIVVATSSP